jgi:hypothetical protein
MDIASLSSVLAQSNLITDVGSALLGKSLDMSENMGNALSQMIDSSALENSVTPYLGGNIDVSI